MGPVRIHRLGVLPVHLSFSIDPRKEERTTGNTAELRAASTITGSATRPAIKYLAQRCVQSPIYDDRVFLPLRLYLSTLRTGPLVSFSLGFFTGSSVPLLDLPDQLVFLTL